MKRLNFNLNEKDHQQFFENLHQFREQTKNYNSSAVDFFREMCCKKKEENK